MRYFKSATFLLLTASSSVSLLSHGAEASPKSDLPNALSAEPQTAKTEPFSLDSMRQASAAVTPTETEAAVYSPYAFANSAESRAPQFSPLLRRLYPESFEGGLGQAEASLGAIAPAEKATEIAADMEAPVSDSTMPVDVEVIVTPAFNETAQAQSLTLEDLRRWVETNEQPSSAIADTTATTPSSVAQNPAEDDTPLTEPDEGLPQLEEDPSPTPIEPEVDTPPDLEEAPANDSVPENPVDIDSTPAPTVQDDAEINELPAILFADPNPLSFPTVPEEVDVDRTPVVTIEQAVELAYQNNQTLQASLLQLEQAEAALREAEAARLPTVTTGADLTNTQNDGSRTVLGGSVELGYDLLTGGSRAASIRAAELQQEVSALAVEAQQEQIRLVTANAYYALQDAGEQIRINQSFLDEAARNLRDSQLREEVGVGTRFDTLRAEVQFANARQALIQSQGDRRIASRDIARVLNLPPTAGIDATPVAVAENWALTLEDSILLAFQNRAELEQQLLQADISEEQRKIALAAIRPRLSLFARYSAQEIIEGSTAFEEDFADSFAVGAQFNWTLYNGGASRASARQQEIGAQLAEEQFSENLDQIRFDVEQAFFNLQSNQENIATSEVAVAQAEEALDLANLRLQAGVGTQLDVLTAQSELTQAQANNVSAILGYNRALVAMERAVSNVRAPF